MDFRFSRTDIYFVCSFFNVWLIGCFFRPIPARSKSYRFWVPLLGRSSESKDPEDVMLTPDAENVALDTFEGQLFDLRRQSAAADHKEQQQQMQLQKQDNAIWRTSSSFKEKGTLSAGENPKWNNTHAMTYITRNPITNSIPLQRYRILK